MQFTKFILDNYLKTEEGFKGLQFFQNLPKYILEGDPDKTVSKFIDCLLLVPLAEEWFNFNCNIRPVVYKKFD